MKTAYSGEIILIYNTDIKNSENSGQTVKENRVIKSESINRTLYTTDAFETHCVNLC